MIRALAGAVLVLAGCGRLGFAAFGDHAGDDAGASDAARDAKLADAFGTGIDAGTCASAIALPIDMAGSGTWVTSVSAIANGSNTGVMYVAPDSNDFGITYAPSGSSLSTATADTEINTKASQAIMAIDIPTGPDMMMASTLTAGSGTELRHLDSTLTARGDTVQPGVAVAVPLAATATSLVVFAYNTDGLNAAEPVSALYVTANGLSSTSAVVIVGAAEAPMLTALVGTTSGFVATWINTATAPATTRGALLDSSLAASAAVSLGTADHGAAHQPRVAWAQSANVYLFAWSELDATNTPNVWIELRDSALAPLVAPQLIGPSGQRPKIASDGTAFWVAWDDGTHSPTGLSAAYVTAAGSATTRPVLGSGGMMIDYDLVDAIAGVELVWFEKNGSMPTTPLWVVPAGSCAL